MPLTVQPTIEEAGKIREIANVTSKTDVLARINQYLDDTDWAEMKLEIPKYGAVKDDFLVISGDGVKIDNSEQRLAIRNRVRVALGYPEVLPDGSFVIVDFSPSFYYGSFDDDSIFESSRDFYR